MAQCLHLCSQFKFKSIYILHMKYNDDLDEGSEEHALYTCVLLHIKNDITTE